MVDIVSLGAGLKAAYEIARAAKEVNDQARLNTAISEIMEQLTSAQFGLFEMQQQHQELIDENRHLMEKLQKEERFERYRLVETPMGDYIRELKEEYVTEDEPAHAICVHCREDGRLSILSNEDLRYRCRHCQRSAWIKPIERQRAGRIVNPGIR